MKNTITISVQDDYLENRAHGDTAFPCAAYYTDANTHDIRWHWHEEYELSIVRSGSCPLSVGTDHLTLHAGDAIFINTGTLHSQGTTQATKDFYKEDLVFHGRLIYGSKHTVFWQKYMAPVATSSISLPYVHLTPVVSWEKEIITLVSDATKLAREKPFGYEFYIREKLSRIFLLLAQNRTELASHSQNESSLEMQHIKKMIRYIQNNYTESISLKQLAQTANICEREVQRSFHNVIRQSPIQYLIHYRIEKACHMLDSGEQSIIDICNSCGFSSPSYFTKTFKSIMGCTPREYRNTR